MEKQWDYSPCILGWPFWPKALEQGLLYSPFLQVLYLLFNVSPDIMYLSMREVLTSPNLMSAHSWVHHVEPLFPRLKRVVEERGGKIIVKVGGRARGIESDFIV